MIPGNQFFFNNGKVSFDADAELYFAQLTPQPSSAFKMAVNDLIVQLKADSNWTTLDRFWIHATEVQQHATISVKNPSSTAITEASSPTWAANLGYTTNGTSSYLNLNYDASVNAVSLTQNNASIGVYCRTSATANVFDIGVQDGSNKLRATILSGGFASPAINESTGTGVVGVVSFTSLGLHNFTRIIAAGARVWQNGIDLGTNNVLSNGIPTGNLYLGCINLSGVAFGFSNRQFAITFIAGAIPNNLAFYNAVQSFATTRGFNV